MIEIILTSSVLILLLAILRRVLRGRISPWVQYALWLLVAARLLIPGTLFTSPVSVVGAAEGLRPSIQETFPDPKAAPDTPPVNASRPVQPPDGAVVSYEILDPETAFSVQKATDWPDVIWKAGMAVTAAALAVSNLAFYLRLRRRRRQLALPAATWSGNLPVYEADGLLSPCLFGLLRPAIYLNEAAMDAEHPEHILAHEYAHYRHGDHVWAVLRCVCLAVHWYNPLVWWAAALCRQDCELACDAAALKRLGEAESIDYGQTLLRMVSRGRNPSALLHTATTMTAGKRAMKERIALIIKQPRMRKVTLAAVVLLACLLTVCTFGGKAEASTEPENEPEEDVAAAVQPEETANPGQDAMQENARSIMEQVQSGADVSEWLPLMNYMDWGVLAQAAVEAGMDEGDGSGAAVEIMFAIDRYVERQGGSMTTAEYLYILSATAGLDGAATEGYAYTIHRMYIMNPSLFAYVALEQLPEEQRNAVLDLFLSEWYYNLVSDSPNMPTREEAIAQLEADLEVGVSATPSEMTLRSAGSTFHFQLVNAFGTYALTYTSSDTSVAEVNGSGVVTAVGPGEATISLHYEGAGGPLDFACRVRCEWGDTGESGFQVREDGARIKEDGSEVIFTAYQQGTKFFPPDWERGYTATYSSSNLAVASVDPEGLVYSEGPGEAVITMHYLDSRGPREYTCLVHCDWDDTVSLGIDDASYRRRKEAFQLYGDDISAWQQRYEDYVANTPDAPAGYINFDGSDLTDIDRKADIYLRDYYTDYFNTFFAQDPFTSDKEISCDVYAYAPASDLSDLTQIPVTYSIRVVPGIVLPNGYMLSAPIQVKEHLSTTLTAERELAAGPSEQPPGELINEWQRAFFGFVFEIPAMPDRELVYDNQTENDLEQAVLSALEEYYRPYVAEHGNSDHNDHFNRIILESEIPAFAEYGEQITVAYQVECQNEREWNGVTYPVTPQAGDHLFTTFTVYDQTNYMM